MGHGAQIPSRLDCRVANPGGRGVTKKTNDSYPSTRNSTSRKFGACLFWTRRFSFLFVVFASLGFPTACTTPPPIHETSPDELRFEIARDAPGLSRRSVVIPHEISDERFAFIHSKVDDLDDPSRGAQALLKLLFDDRYLGLQYRWGETESAEITIAKGGGNCLSLAAVLVGTARRYSGAARYIEIQDYPERKDVGDLQIWSSHIAVLLPSVNGPLIIDFRGIQKESPSVRFHRLGDRALVAHYYNDRGYDLIRQAHDDDQTVPWQEAARQFEIATQVDPELSRAWNNLGVARARLGQLEGAEDAYQRALGTSDQFMEEATADNLISLDFRRLKSNDTPD